MTLDEEYWEACARRELRLQRCSECARWRFPASANCPQCLSRGYEWRQVSGRGTVWSWIRMHRPYFPAMKDRLPYLVALISLEEGPRIMSTVVGTDEVACDMPVAVDFEEIAGNLLPVFRPAEVVADAR
jgi:uncharacterized OB-fold protein